LIATPKISANAKRAFYVGEARGMKSRSIWNCAALAGAIAGLWLGGCGSSNNATNAVTVTVTSSVGTIIIVGQSTTLTATVTGGTTSNTAVNWQPCQFTTTTVSGTTATPSTPATCPTDGTLGTLSNEQTTGTATYTAPGKFPDQTKFPGLLIIITAQSQQDTKKTGSIKLALESGIGVTLTPVTATVATNEPQTFNAGLTNDLQTQGVTWLVTQSTPTTTITVPNLATCSPTCGSITFDPKTSTTATYTAPATVPTASTPSGASTTPSDVTVVAVAKGDNTRFATGTITIIQGGPITFGGISPTIAPQGGALWDIYLNAPNISSASKITITDQNNGSTTFDSSSGQIKVLFPIPTSTTLNPSSSGARLRLLESNLAGVTTATGSVTPLTYTVSVTDPGEPVTQTSGGQFTFTLIPVRPTVVASSPNGVVQGAATAEFPVAIDGGYFGPGGTFAPASFQGNQLSQTGSNSRRLIATFKSSAVGPPGLYPLTVSRSTNPLPSPNNAAVTTIAVFPDYSSGPPAAPVGPGIPAGTNPSAIDIDPTLGVVVVAETGSNAVQFYSIGTGTPPLTPIGGPVAVGQLPTGVSVNPTNHCVAVVNYGSQSVSILPIPGSSCPVTSTTTVDLSGALQGQVSPAPLPYAIGVDPDTNLAIVAYSSTSSSSLANLGFVVNLNQGAAAPFGCLGNSGTPPCIFSEVTLNTGAYPQIAMAPHGHMAYVTPGGSGTVRGVNVLQPSTSIGLSTLALTVGGTVTATTANSTPLTGLVPGIPTTVLISGVPLPNTTGNPTSVNFNGVFTVAVTSSTSFQYSLGPSVTGSGTANGGTVFFGSPNLVFGGLSNTTQGIAINPITHTAALADANATSQQINVLNQLDQSFTSISFQTNCTAFTIPCNSSGELPGTARVAWQPYTNSIISYNPGVPGTPVNQVSISDPVTRQRYALVNMPSGTTGSANITVQNGTTNSLTLWGGVAVDPATNQAFIVQSGSGVIQIIDLTALPVTSPTNIMKSAEITQVVVPSPPNSGPGVIGGIPNALVPQATLTSATPLPGVQIFGTGFVSGSTQVLLDNTDITSQPGASVNVVSKREVDVTIPAFFLSLPHHYALSVVVSGGVQSNATDFIVIKAVDMTVACATPTPSSVAIADQLANGPFSPIALVTNSGCNNLSTIDINPSSATFGTVLRSLPIGATPQGVAVSSHLGMAVVANNGGGTVSVVNLLTNAEAVPDVTVGSSPTGVAVNEATGVALVTNFGSNTVSQINLGLLFGSSPPTSLTATPITGIQAPVAVAIDPDRGTNNQGLAVVTGIPLISSSPSGTLYPVDIGLASPSLSTTVSIGSVNSSPTGIVFNPAVATGTANPGLFYVNSSGTNQISAFNPDTGIASPTSVGINPTALAVNPQSGAILTSNFAGKSASIVDTVSSPIKTVQTLGLPGSAQFGVAIDQFTNLAVIVDQANNRVLLFPMPN
jgi:DNA-binding beta-propeller fold protein YncE